MPENKKTKESTTPETPQDDLVARMLKTTRSAPPEPCEDCPGGGGFGTDDATEQ